MNRDPNGNPDRTGEYPKVPPAQHPPRQDLEAVPVTEERAPIDWNAKLWEILAAIGILAALALFVWSWFRFSGGAP